MTKTTLRAHICIVNFSLLYFNLLLIFAIGCSGKGNLRMVSSLKGAQTIDTNEDGKPDRWTWQTSPSEPDGLPVTVREEADLNYDGIIDIRKTYQNGVLDRTFMDLDFDGQFDREELYESGELIKTTLSYGFGSKKYTWKYYEKGQLKRIEKDTNADGSADQWLYYENNRLARRGIDYNHDGTVDHWENSENTN